MLVASHSTARDVLADVLLDHLRAAGTIAPVIDGRSSDGGLAIGGLFVP